MAGIYNYERQKRMDVCARGERYTVNRLSLNQRMGVGTYARCILPQAFQNHFTVTATAISVNVRCIAVSGASLTRTIISPKWPVNNCVPFWFQNHCRRKIMVKFALSPVSTAGALQNHRTQKRAGLEFWKVKPRMHKKCLAERIITHRHPHRQHRRINGLLCFYVPHS